MRLRLQHWLTALGLAASLHLGLALLLDPPRPGARGPGQGGIEIALGPAGGAARAVTETRERESPEDSPARSPSGRAETPAPSAALERRPEPEAVVSKPKEPEPKPGSEPKPKPEPKPEPEPSPLARTPLADHPAPAPSSPPSARRSEPEPPAHPSSPAEAGDSGTGQTGESGPDPAGAGDATPGGGDPGAAADYLAWLRAWLERHRRYPLKARLRRQEGTVWLGFVVDSQGRVLSRRIEAGSGHALLDREALDLLRRAEPLPAPPPGLGRLELIVPVVFSLR